MKWPLGKRVAVEPAPEKIEPVKIDPPMPKRYHDFLNLVWVRKPGHAKETDVVCAKIMKTLGHRRVPLEGIQGIKYDFEVEAYNKGLAEDARLREELQRGER